MKFFISLTIVLALIFSVFAFSVEASEVGINYNTAITVEGLSKFVPKVDINCRDVNLILTTSNIYFNCPGSKLYIKIPDKIFFRFLAE